MMTCRGSRTTGRPLRRTPAEPAFAALVHLQRRRYPACERGGCSSVGRAPGCGPGGRGFESHQPPHRRKSRLRRMTFVGIAASQSGCKEAGKARLRGAARPIRFRRRRRYAAAHGPVAQRIERRTSNPCAEVRLLPGPLRGAIRPAARAMMIAPRSRFDPLRSWPPRAKPVPAADQSVQGRCSAAAGTNPLRDRLPVRALSAGVCLLACPARS